MTPGVILGTLFGTALATALLTRALLGWLTRHAPDVPGARSMHSRITPRGGGLAFAAVVLLVQGVLTGATAAPQTTWPGWLAALAFAAIGWMDDRRSRSVRLRLGLQALVASLYALAEAATLMPGAPLAARVGAGVVLAFGVMWMVNLSNFLDGADGYCATQSMLLALAGALLLVTLGAEVAAVLALAMAGACAGFLVWNRPPAQLFMGDVGSYFLGFEAVVLTACAIKAGGSLWPWLILAAPFVVDATLTLARRAARGAALGEGHREHAYQRLLLGGWSARRLLAALAISHLCLWWPLAALAVHAAQFAPWLTLLAHVLAAIMWHLANRRASRS